MLLIQSLNCTRIMLLCFIVSHQLLILIVNLITTWLEGIIQTLGQFVVYIQITINLIVIEIAILIFEVLKCVLAHGIAGWWYFIEILWLFILFINKLVIIILKFRHLFATCMIITSVLELQFFNGYPGLLFTSLFKA